MGIIGSLKARVRARLAAGLGLAVAVLGQVNPTNITDTINAILPIVMSLFAILIPLVFLMKIFDVFERIFRDFR